MKVERERRKKATVFLTPSLHRRAEGLAGKLDTSVSEVLALALARYLKDGAPRGSELPARKEGEIKTSVFLSAGLRARAKRAAIEGGSLQDFFVWALERELNGAKAA